MKIVTEKYVCCRKKLETASQTDGTCVLLDEAFDGKFKPFSICKIVLASERLLARVHYAI